MQTERTPAPVSRALLLAFASASVLCALDAALHPAPAAAHGSPATAMALAGSTLRSWLAWQTLAETFFGSVEVSIHGTGKFVRFYYHRLCIKACVELYFIQRM